jgi:protein-S-isoprenylcysteine O-methyltransferase Ste14
MSGTATHARATARGAVLAERLRLAHTHWTRLRGLLGTASLPAGEGLWLMPCNQVHMIGMRYALDVVFLDDERRVVRTISGLAPGKISPKVAEASSVLELPVGTLSQTGLTEGARVEIEGAGASGARPENAVAALNALACNLLLAGLYLFFASAHVAFARRTGQWLTVVPLMALESGVMAVLFLTRRRSMTTSSRPFDWAVGITGVVLPLLMRPTDGPGSFASAAAALQIIGVTLAIVSLLFLGRSIGVVAANRGIKTAGPYAVVRHPTYAAYALVYVGYVLKYTSLWNVLIAGVTIAALGVRALVEERLLVGDPRYRAYLQHTRWRFLPYLY